jgi:glyoxylase-like metal-dependent hydrolase (beta-lactamase superfamily II)
VTSQPRTDRRTPEWAQPGAETVAPGVHRVPLPLPMDGLRAVNVYVLETDDGLTCIDGGWAIDASRELFEKTLADLGHHVRDIRRFLVTHAHRDHYTQAATIREEYGAAVVELGVGDKQTLDLFNSGQLTEDPTVARLRLGGAADTAAAWQAMFEDSDPDLAMWAPPDTWLDGEQTLVVGDRRLRAVPTPGHTAGHFVFADEQAGLLFAGDHVLPTITPSVGFELVYQPDPLRDFLGSLRRVRELPDLRLLPAHGAVTDSSHARVGELLAHHDARLERCRAAVAAGACTAYDVARALPWTRRERAFDELDVFNAAMAVMETMVHLDLLAGDGVLTRDEVDGAAVYGSIIS